MRRKKAAGFMFARRFVAQELKRIKIRKWLGKVGTSEIILLNPHSIHFNIDWSIDKEKNYPGIILFNCVNIFRNVNGPHAEAATVRATGRRDPPARCSRSFLK